MLGSAVETTRREGCSGPKWPHTKFEHIPGRLMPVREGASHGLPVRQGNELRRFARREWRWLFPIRHVLPKFMARLQRKDKRAVFSLQPLRESDMLSLKTIRHDCRKRDLGLPRVFNECLS